MHRRRRFHHDKRIDHARQLAKADLEQVDAIVEQQGDVVDLARRETLGLPRARHVREDAVRVAARRRLVIAIHGQVQPREELDAILVELRRRSLAELAAPVQPRRPREPDRDGRRGDAMVPDEQDGRGNEEQQE